MISKTSFKHGWYYHYRVHDIKAKQIEQKFPQLVTFLKNSFHNCPHKYFESGPRGSHLKFKLPELSLASVTGHEVSSLARTGLEVNDERFKSNHMKVQAFMLENDNKTIAMEVPLWFHPEEMEQYSTIFPSTEPLTGHIDILRVEDGKIWVWDYKPGAVQEKFAATQVYFYALMLSRRTNIPLEHFRCGYFDSAYAFLFKPESQMLLQNIAMKKLNSF